MPLIAVIFLLPLISMFVLMATVPLMHISPYLNIAIVQPPQSPINEAVPWVVVVEPDKAVRKLLCQVLTDTQQYQAITCEEPSACLRFLEAHHTQVACVLTALRFTRYSATEGVQLVQRIRRDYPHVATLALAGVLDDVAVGGIHNLGVTSIKKPFDLATLTRALKRCTNGR